MIVVDTNILMFSVGPAPQPALYRSLLRRDHRWLAPLLWRSEFRSALAGYVRKGDATYSNAVNMANKARQLLEMELEPDTEIVLRLVTTSKCSAYDLEYVAVAVARGVRLVTMDKQVLREFPEIAVHPADFVA